MSAKTLRIVAHLKVQPDKQADARAILMAMLDPTRKEAGCVSYQLYTNHEDPAEFTFVEEWADGAAFDAHLASDHVQQALGQVSGLLAGPPDIRRYQLIG